MPAILLTDFHLDPDIAEFCTRDVNKFCGLISDKEHRGDIMKCLKKQLKVSLIVGLINSFDMKLRHLSSIWANLFGMYLISKDGNYVKEGNVNELVSSSD